MSDMLPGEGFNTFETRDKVLVGVSGGVDSAVTVRILQEQGFLVQGAVIRFSPAHDAAVEAAKLAAEQLQIDLNVIDAQDAFDRIVVEDFCQSYCSGRTPNPCILCNPMVKFRQMCLAADALGIPYIATGHYARVETDANGICRVAVPASAARDQSYMLYRLPQNILRRLILPLGEFEKDDVREIAHDIGLSNADAPDSMEICFIPDGDHAAFIAGRGLQSKSGHFRGPLGEDLGAHLGVHHYTIGQRKGLGIAYGQPLFVREICENGDIQLAKAGEEFFSRVTIGDIATPDGLPLPAGQYLCKIRSAAKPAPCSFDGEQLLTFDTPVRAPAPGQSAVLYRDDLVMGGGFIRSAE